MIACVVIPDYVTTVERKLAPTINEALLLLDPSAVVQGASRAAAQSGVRCGMRLGKAQALCPEAEGRMFDARPYRETADAVLEQLADFSDQVELTPGFWDTRRKASKRDKTHPAAAFFYLDSGRLEANQSLKLAQQIGQDLSQHCQVWPVIGLGSGKFAATAAARSAKSNHPKMIPEGQETKLLGSWPVTLLPVKAEVIRRLHLLGIRTLSQIAALPRAALVDQFGEAGRVMHQLATGVDERPIVPQPPRKVERLTVHLEGGVEDRLQLEAILHALGAELAHQVDGKGVAARKLELWIRTADGSTFHKETVLRQPTQEGSRFGRAFVRLLSKLTLASGVLEIEMVADDLQPVIWRQLELFPKPASAQERLEGLLLSLTERFGEDCFYRIRVIDAQHRLIERRFQFERVEAA
ncbi:MAG: hypothetical protein ABI690_16835 [Chloroflexota bacterium]